MSETPEHLLYVDSHEWILVEGNTAKIGITDHAQEALNDIVFVELPQVGDSLSQGDEFGVVESVKSVSELYMPIGGEITAVNDALEDSPETLNEDPYGAWIVELEIGDETELEGLLSAAAYKALIA